MLPPGCSQPAVSGSSGKLCTLSADKKTFICDVEFGAQNGSCEPGDVPRAVFLDRMTYVSLEMLYLEREPGGKGPFRYNDMRGVIRRITVDGCSGSCVCRFRYTDPDLDEIFYDSAGCRSGSRFSEHPLYFRGKGCR